MTCLQVKAPPQGGAGIRLLWVGELNEKYADRFYWFKPLKAKRGER